MSRLIRIFTVCLVNLLLIPIIKISYKQGRCPNLADRPNLPDFVLMLLSKEEGKDQESIKSSSAPDPEHHMMRNARFWPLTLLMTLRVIDVKSDDKFMRLLNTFQSMTLTPNSRLRLFLSEQIYPLYSLSNYLQ